MAAALDLKSAEFVTELSKYRESLRVRESTLAAKERELQVAQVELEESKTENRHQLAFMFHMGSALSLEARQKGAMASTLLKLEEKINMQQQKHQDLLKVSSEPLKEKMLELEQAKQTLALKKEELKEREKCFQKRKLRFARIRETLEFELEWKEKSLRRLMKRVTWAKDDLRGDSEEYFRQFPKLRELRQVIDDAFAEANELTFSSSTSISGKISEANGF